MPRDAATGRVQLKPAQERVLGALAASAESELTRGQYEKLAGVSRSQAAYDLADLVEAGILHRVGSGRATHYRLAQEGGGQRRWTEERIRTELEAFCASRQTWPSAAAFKAAGRGDLYVAASRYGGISHWAETLGYPRPGRAATSESQPQPPSLRRKLMWAAAGALAAIGLAAAAGGVVFGLTRNTATVSPVASAPRAPAGAAPREPARPTSKSTKPRSARTTAQRKPRQRARRATAPSRPRETSASSISHTAPVRSSSPPAQSSSTGLVTRQYTSASAMPSGPTPLPAPSTGSGPEPIRAP